MTEYTCIVADSKGRKRSVLVRAENESDVRASFSGTDEYLIQVRALSESHGMRPGRISQNSLLEITETLSLMVSSGLTVQDSLEVCSDIFRKGNPALLIRSLLSRIEKGDRFHEALVNVSVRVPPLYIGMMRIGERIGSLDQVLAHLAGYLGEARKLREKTVNALIYPALIILVALVGAIFAFVFAVPRMRLFLQQTGVGGDAGLNMQGVSFLIGVGILFTGVLVAALVISILTARLPRENAFAKRLDMLILSLPLIGTYIRHREVLNFLFAMETMISCDIQMEDGLTEALATLHNRKAVADTRMIKDRVTAGGSLSSAFRETDFFPARIARWIAVGERVGEVEDIFASLRKYYQNELEKWVVRFTNLIEPVLILLVGVFLIFFILFFVVPLLTYYMNIL